MTTLQRILFLLSCAGLLALAAGVQAEESGWRPLFNGRDLSGWEGAPGFWRVEDGAITGETTPERNLGYHTYLIWRGGEAGDFELRLRFRILKGNSGVQYRSRDLGGFVMAGYQCNIEPTKPTAMAVLEEMKTGRGGHLAEVGQCVRFRPDGASEVTGQTGETTATLKAAQRRGDWNEMTIRAEGPRLRHWFNGRLIVDVTDESEGQSARNGIMGLQLHAGPPMKVQFKDIRLKIGQ